MIALWLCGWAQAATLEQAWEAVETRSHEAAMAASQREQLEITPFRVAAGLLPRVYVEGGVTWNQVEVAFDPGAMFPPEIGDLVESLTEAPLDLGDPIIIQRKMALDASLTILQPLILAPAFAQAAGVDDVVAQARAQERAVLARLRTGVTQAYWGVVVTREAVSLARSALKNAEDHLGVAVQHVDVGLLPPQAKLQAELAVSRGRRELAAAEAREKVAERVLAALTRFAEDEPLEVPAALTIPYASADDAAAQALARRPDLVAAELAVNIARTQRLAQQLGWVPVVQGQFTEGWSQNTGFAGRNWLWTAGIRLSWPLWDGGARLADTMAARSQLHLAEEALAKAQDDTRLAVTQAWVEVGRARAALAAVEQEVALAQENLRIAELSLSAGNSPFQDVEDARLALHAAELGRVQERMSEHLAVVTLLVVTGDLGGG